MKTVSTELPVFVFFDTAGTVISYRHPECDSLYGLTLDEFEREAKRFNPSIPNAFTTVPDRYPFPIEVLLNDEGLVCHLESPCIDSVYGKTHEELLKLTS